MSETEPTGHNPADGQLPEGWEAKRIVDVLEKLPNGKLINQGKSPQCEKEPSTDESVWGVLKTTAIQAGEFLPEHNKRLPDALAPSEGIEVNEGDLLLTCAGPRVRCGVPCLVRTTRPRLLLSGKMYRFRANQEIADPNFLEFFLLSPSAQKAIDEMKTGTSESGLNLTHGRFSELQVPVPPLAEQERIVEILEEQLSRLDAALESVRVVREKAAQFCRSLLHAAFTGTLTGHNPADGQLPEGWDPTPLADLLEFSIGGIWGSEEGTSEINVDVIRVTELKSHGVIEPATAARRSITNKQLESRALQEGDLLLEKSGGGPNTPVGRVGYVPDLANNSVCSNFMQLMRPNRAVVRVKYLHLFLTGFHSNGGTVALQTATTNIRNIKSSEYVKTPVPLPPLAEQERIVEILEEQLSRLDAALAVADAIEKRSAALRRSLLHSAFTGRLTEKWRESVHV